MASTFLSQTQRSYLMERYGLEEKGLELLLEDLWSFTAERPEAYAIRRHAELQREGRANDSIFSTIAEELSQGRFSCPETSIRQVRRMIYG